MFKEVGWQFFINAKTEEKAKTVLKRIEQVVGKLEINSLKRYWKDNNLYVAECKSIFRIEEPEKAIFNILVLVNQLAHDIEVVGPLLYENGQVEFEGNCSRTSIIGLEWFRFYIDNFR